MSASKICKVNHKTGDKLLLLLALLLLKLEALSEGVGASSSELDDLLGDNLHTQTRELNRTNALILKPSSRNLQEVRLDSSATRRQHQLVRTQELLASSSSNQAQVIANPRNVSSARQAQMKPAAPAAFQANASTSLSSVRLKWRQMEASLAGSLARTSGELRRTLEQLLNLQQEARPLPVSAQCQASLAEFLSALAEQELWAGQMLDASATHLPNGLLEGTLTELGHFDECLAVTNGRAIFGQYCSLLIKPALVSRPRLHTICRRLPSLASGGGGGGGANSSSGSGSQVMRFLSQNSHQLLYAGLRLGICLPSKCRQSDVQLLLSAYLQPFELSGQVRQCEQQQQRQETQHLRSDENSTSALVAFLQAAYKSSPIWQKFDLIQQCILLAFCTLILLVGLGSLLDTSLRAARKEALVVQADLTSSSSVVVPAKRWQQYQVCRSTSGADSSASCSDHCTQPVHLAPLPSSLYLNQVATEGHTPSEPCLHGERVAPPPPPPPAHSLGLQKNPIAEFVIISTPPSTPATISTAHSSRSSSCMLDNSHEINECLTPGKQRARAVCMIANNNNNNNNISEMQFANSTETTSSTSDSQSLLRQFLVCFSLSSNLRSIGKLSSGSHGADIKVVHGIRTLSMIWIIFGHTIGLVGPEMMNNLFALAQLSCSSRLLQALLNATLAVDTFFMISGLVTAISFVRKCSSAGQLINGSAAGNSAELKEEDLLTLRQSSGAQHRLQHQLRQQHHQQQQQQQQQQEAASRSKRATSVIDLEEISSVDSSSSAVSSFSSSASSKRCISSTTTNATNETCGKGNKRGRSRGRGGALEHSITTGERADCWWPSDFKPLMWLLMRYLRLTPAYASIIGLSIVLPALGSGPFWAETVSQMGSACRANWWTNLIYLNNFLETDKLCLIHSWYLSNDWQFFLLTLMLFASFYKSQKLTLLLVITLILASSATTLIATIENDFPPTIVTTSPAVAERWQFIHQLYYKPWPHLPAYLVGLLTGYLILRHHHNQISPAARASANGSAGSGQLSRPARLFCWSLFSLIGLAVLNSIYPWNMGIQVDPLLTGLHSATFRTLWATSCGWLVYALVTRPLNPLARLLAWPGFQLTSRLTYCAYLIHPLVIYYHLGTLRERLDSSPYGQLHRFMATLVLSYLFALLLSLLVESPSIQLQRFLTRLASSSNQNHAHHNNNNDNHHHHQQQQQAKSVGMKSKLSKKKSNDRSDSNQVQPDSHLQQYWSTASTNNIKATSNQISAMQKHPNQRLESKLELPVVMLHHQTCEHRMDSNNNNNNNHVQLNSQATLDQEQKDRCSSQSSSHSASAIDVEFQKKLAQAIGRGFKIRTKIVNGSIKGQQARRQAVAKRPLGDQQATPAIITHQEPISDNSTESGADDLHHRLEVKAKACRPPVKLALVARGRGGDQMSTFVSSPSQHYIRPTGRKTLDLNMEHTAECFTTPSADHQNGSHVQHSEMLQLKQKLLMKPQEAIANMP